MSHRHLLPGGIQTGPAIPVMNDAGEIIGHKHKTVGGDGVTSVVKGESDDSHRHTANGQGTSGPIPMKNETSVEGKMNAKENAKPAG